MDLLVGQISFRCLCLSDIPGPSRQHLDHVRAAICLHDKSARGRAHFLRVFFRFIKAVDCSRDRHCVRFLFLFFLGRILDKSDLPFLRYLRRFHGRQLVFCHCDIISLYVQFKSRGSLGLLQSVFSARHCKLIRGSVLSCLQLSGGLSVTVIQSVLSALQAVGAAARSGVRGYFLHPDPALFNNGFI